MSLLDRTVEFAGALRQAGIPVSTAETVDAMRALGKVDIIEREHLRAAFAATACKRAAAPADLRHALRPVVPAEDRRRRSATEDFDGDGARRRRGRADRTPPTSPRRCASSCATCCSTATRTRSGASPGPRSAASGVPTRRPGGSRYFAYRVLRALSPETLIASLLAAMLGDQERGGLAEKVARQTIADRIKAFEEAVESEVRRRLAETKGVESVTQDGREAADRPGRFPARLA